MLIAKNPWSICQCPLLLKSFEARLLNEKCVCTSYFLKIHVDVYLKFLLMCTKLTSNINLQG